MAIIKQPDGGQFTAYGQVADYWAAQPGFSRVYTPDEAAEFKGEALDAALHDAGLSTTGSADDKRARLTGAPAPTNPEGE